MAGVFALMLAGIGANLLKPWPVAGVVLASINVFGGFLVTQRMLEMFKKKDKKEGA